MAYGFIYVLSNESMPDIYKIGCTTKHPMARAKELSSSTSCATPFELVRYFGCRNPHVIEHAVHQNLEKFRVNSSREFFEADLLVIFEGIASVFDEFHGHEDVNGDYQDIRADVLFNAYINSLVAEKEWKIQHFINQCPDVEGWKKVGFE